MSSLLTKVSHFFDVSCIHTTFSCISLQIDWSPEKGLYKPNTQLVGNESDICTLFVISLIVIPALSYDLGFYIFFYQ